MDLIAYKNGGLEYFESLYGYMSDKAILKFREYYRQKTGDIQFITDEQLTEIPEKTKRLYKTKFSMEYKDAIVKMYNSGKNRVQIARYMNTLNNGYTYTPDQISDCMYRYKNGR